MTEVPEPIKSVLRDYCHVEWFEVDELADDVQTGRHKYNVDKLREQFEALISSEEDYSDQINSLTSNEFESREEAKAWLNHIYETVFR